MGMTNCLLMRQWWQTKNKTNVGPRLPCLGSSDSKRNHKTVGVEMMGWAQPSLFPFQSHVTICRNTLCVSATGDESTMTVHGWCQICWAFRCQADLAQTLNYHGRYISHSWCWKGKLYASGTRWRLRVKLAMKVCRMIGWWRWERLADDRTLVARETKTLNACRS